MQVYGEEKTLNRKSSFDKSTTEIPHVSFTDLNKTADNFNKLRDSLTDPQTKESVKSFDPNSYKMSIKKLEK